MKKEDAVNAVASLVASYGTGELLRYLGRQTGVVETGLLSNTLVPFAGGLAVTGAQAARKQNLPPVLLGSMLGSSLAAFRPKLWQSQAEQDEEFMNVFAKQLEEEPPEQPNYLEAKNQLKLLQESQAGSMAIMPGLVNSGMVRISDSLSFNNGLPAKKFIEGINAGQVFYFSFYKKILIEDFEDFHAVGDLLAVAMMGLSAEKNVLAETVRDWFNSTQFLGSEYMRKARNGIADTFDGLAPWGVDAVQGHYYGDIKDVRFPSQWAVDIRSIAERDFLIEYATIRMMQIVSSAAISKDMGTSNFVFASKIVGNMVSGAISGATKMLTFNPIGFISGVFEVAVAIFNFFKKQGEKKRLEEKTFNDIANTAIIMVKKVLSQFRHFEFSPKVGQSYKVEEFPAYQLKCFFDSYDNPYARKENPANIHPNLWEIMTYAIQPPGGLRLDHPQLPFFYHRFSFPFFSEFRFNSNLLYFIFIIDRNVADDDPVLAYMNGNPRDGYPAVTWQGRYKQGLLSVDVK